MTVTASVGEGRVIRVLDGDTIEVMNADDQPVRVRLYGIDTPEVRGGNLMWKALIKIGMAYGRVVGVISIGCLVLSAEIFKAGVAWCCKESSCSDWKQLEEKALSSKIGLRNDPDQTSPWEYREPKKGKEKTSKPEVSTGKYQGNTESMKFHLPGCKHYDCKNCTATFTTRGNAIDSGYVPCGICKP